jgi:hypothetical protein
MHESPTASGKTGFIPAPQGAASCDGLETERDRRMTNERAFMI